MPHIVNLNADQQSQRWIQLLRSGWMKYQQVLLPLAIGVMVIGALWRLEDGYSCLLRGERVRPCAVDLKTLHVWVHGWFAGRAQGRSTLPPASHAILWPLVGWLPLAPVLWLWGATSLAALVWLSVILVRESGAETRTERLFVGLVPFCMTATRVALQNGQLILHLLPPLLAGLLLLARGQPGWRRDVLATGLLLVGFAKPSVSAPFILLVMVGAGPLLGRVRALMLLGVSYGALTFLAASFQPSGAVSLLRGWASGAVTQAAAEFANPTGYYGNLHSWLGVLGRDDWNLPASLLALGALAWWVFRHRHADIWILLGVTGICARVWTYHRLYDDVLIVLPLVALFRLAKRMVPGGGFGVSAGVLAAVTWAAVLAPARLFVLPAPREEFVMVAETITWLAVLVFLISIALADPRRPSGDAE